MTKKLINKREFETFEKDWMMKLKWIAYYALLHFSAIVRCHSIFATQVVWKSSLILATFGKLCIRHY